MRDRTRAGLHAFPLKPRVIDAQKRSPPGFIRCTLLLLQTITDTFVYLVQIAAITASVGRKELDIPPVGKCLLTWVSAARRDSGGLDPNPASYRALLALLDGVTCIFCHRPIKLSPLASRFKSIIINHHADGLYEQWPWNDVDTFV